MIHDDENRIGNIILQQMFFLQVLFVCFLTKEIDDGDRNDVLFCLFFTMKSVNMTNIVITTERLGGGDMR